MKSEYIANSNTETSFWHQKYLLKDIAVYRECSGETES